MTKEKRSEFDVEGVRPLGGIGVSTKGSGRKHRTGGLMRASPKGGLMRGGLMRGGKGKNKRRRRRGRGRCATSGEGFLTSLIPMGIDLISNIFK